jgi:hypothetical protein
MARTAFSSFFIFDLSVALARHKKNCIAESKTGSFDMSTSKQPQFANQATLKQALVAGAIAGTAVDTALFPLGMYSFSLN